MLYYFWHQIHTPTHYLAKLALLFISLTKNKITLMTAKFGGLKSFFLLFFFHYCSSTYCLNDYILLPFSVGRFITACVVYLVCQHKVTITLFKLLLLLLMAFNNTCL